MLSSLGPPDWANRDSATWNFYGENHQKTVTANLFVWESKTEHKTLGPLFQAYLEVCDEERGGCPDGRHLEHLGDEKNIPDPTTIRPSVSRLSERRRSGYLGRTVSHGES